VAEHRRSRASAQQVGVVDAVPTRHQGVDQDQHLAARVSGTGAVAQVDQLVGQLLDAQPPGQRGGQQQAGVGDGVVVVEGDGEPVGLWEDCIEKCLLVGTDGRLSNAIVPAQRAFLIIRLRLDPPTQRWTQAKRGEWRRRSGRERHRWTACG
jgi:hypothetical protein